MRTAAVWLFLLLLAVPAGAAPAHKTRKVFDLADKVDNSVILSKFAALVAASDLGTFLSSRGPFTLFVPTNSAFSRLPPGMYEDLLRPENKTQLQRIILFHLVNGQDVDAKDMKTLKSLPSCEGNPIPLKLTRTGTQYIGKGRLIRADEKCANGVLNEIDTMLMPPNLVLVAATETPAPDAATNAASTDTNAVPADTNAAPLETNAAPATNSIQ